MVYLPNICHILPLKTTIHVGKYTSPMDGMGYRLGGWCFIQSPPFEIVKIQVGLGGSCQLLGCDRNLNLAPSLSE